MTDHSSVQPGDTNLVARRENHRPEPQLPPAARLVIFGQVLGAAGIVLQWLTAPEFFPGFPPGVIYVAAAAAIVWIDRRSPWAPVSAVLLSAFIVVGGLAGGDVGRNLGAGNAGLIAGVLVMVFGLLLSVVAAGFAIRDGLRTAPGPQPKPYSRANPHRTALLIAVAGLFLAAISDFAPEGLHWDGPGPVLFLLLGLLVLFVPGRHIVLLSAVFSAAFVYGAFANQQSLEHFRTPSDTVNFVFAILQVAGYATATVAGVLACLPDRVRRA